MMKTEICSINCEKRANCIQIDFLAVKPFIKSYINCLNNYGNIKQDHQKIK
jgi:hypothetical protein